MYNVLSWLFVIRNFSSINWCREQEYFLENFCVCYFGATFLTAGQFKYLFLGTDSIDELNYPRLADYILIFTQSTLYAAHEMYYVLNFK